MSYNGYGESKLKKAAASVELAFFILLLIYSIFNIVDDYHPFIENVKWLQIILVILTVIFFIADFILNAFTKFESVGAVFKYSKIIALLLLVAVVLVIAGDASFIGICIIPVARPDWWEIRVLKIVLFSLVWFRFAYTLVANILMKKPILCLFWFISLAVVIVLGVSQCFPGILAVN